MRTKSHTAHGVSGWILGYDPGGNDNHGVAAVKVRMGRAVDLSADTCETSGAALEWLGKYSAPLAVGIDTLLAWSSARNGDRPADRALRAHYTQVASSVLSPNALYGAMCVNGALMALRLIDRNPKKPPLLMETHPKVLYFALAGTRHAWPDRRTGMIRQLADWLELPRQLEIEILKEHAYDAALSAYAALESLRGRWRANLLDLPLNGKPLLFLAAQATYPWPNEVPPAPAPNAGRRVAVSRSEDGRRLGG
jgi:hypothetical protein